MASGTPCLTCKHTFSLTIIARQARSYNAGFTYMNSTTVTGPFALQGDYWRMPRPLTSKRAQAMYSTIVATTIKVRATLILMSETPRMP